MQDHFFSPFNAFLGIKLILNQETKYVNIYLNHIDISTNVI